MRDSTLSLNGCRVLNSNCNAVVFMGMCGTGVVVCTVFTLSVWKGVCIRLYAHFIQLLITKTHLVACY